MRGGAHSGVEGRVRRWKLQSTGAEENLPARGSGRDGGVDSGIDLRRHEAAPENLGSVLSDLRLRLSAKNA